MKSTNTTHVVSYISLGLFGVYSLVSIGMTGFLFSLAVGLVVFSLVESVELATAIVIIMGLLFKAYFGPITKMSVETKTTSPGEGFRDTIQTIQNRITKNAIKQPVGVYSSSFVEGFADASSSTSGQASGTQKTDDVGSSESKPVALDTPPEVKEEKVPSIVQKFEDSSTAGEGLFKLGELPTENKSGPHVDQGTTLMNAIGSLKPDQIQGMTDDTRKLLDTQKNLMGMLQTMKPMLNDGKQLMDTFQQMFGNSK